MASKLPVNLVERKNRRGYYFRRRRGGKTYWRYLGADLGEAKTAYRQIVNQDLPLNNSTVKRVASRWLSNYIASTRNQKGQKLARQRVKTYLEPNLGHFPLHRLNATHLREYRLKLEGLGLSPQSTVHILSDLRCCLRWCEDSGLIAKSLFPQRLLPRIQERPPDRLTAEEEDQLSQLSEPYGFTCRLGLDTGLRWAELSRSQRADVDGEFLVVHNTKSGKLRRVPLSREVLDELQSKVGRLVPFSANSSGSFARTVRGMTGIQHFRTHLFRHTFACKWAERQGNLFSLQQILGHQDIKTTQRYARLTDAIVLAEKERISSLGIPAGIPRNASA